MDRGRDLPRFIPSSGVALALAQCPCLLEIDQGPIIQASWAHICRCPLAQEHPPPFGLQGLAVGHRLKCFGNGLVWVGNLALSPINGVILTLVRLRVLAWDRGSSLLLQDPDETRRSLSGGGNSACVGSEASWVGWRQNGEKLGSEAFC